MVIVSLTLAYIALIVVALGVVDHMMPTASLVVEILAMALAVIWPLSLALFILVMGIALLERLGGWLADNVFEPLFELCVGGGK